VCVTHGEIINTYSITFRKRWIFRKWDVGGVEWIELAQDKERWQKFVNTVMNLQVP